MSKVYGIILSGGTGSRIGSEKPKQFIEIAGVPLLVRTLAAFDAHSKIDALVLVAHPDYLDWSVQLARDYGIAKIIATVPGGETRQQSAYNALTAIPYCDDDIVLIHDAARPFVNTDTINEVIALVQSQGAATTCVPTTDTVVTTDSTETILSTPERTTLRMIQTPQGFRYATIQNAHKTAIRNARFNASDDTQLVLEAGGTVALAKGSYHNIKVTTTVDLLVAEEIANEYPVTGLKHP